MQTTNYNDIFDYITIQENNYKKPIPINDTWPWSMKDHIKTSELYSHSQLLNGKDDFTPVKNITRPILNLQHRAEDIELKDVQLYVDDPENYHLSFLVKKYHDDVFVQENDLDTFFDELNVSRIDYGGGLSKQLNKPCPEVVPLQSIAFCDQTDMLSGPIGIKHYYSPDQLLAMGEKGWGDESNGATISLEDLIILSREEKKDDNTNNQAATTPGRYIEIYEVHGNLPKKFADKTDNSEKYETRLFICAFYQKKNSTDKQGVILYTAKEKKIPFKLVKRDSVYGRALGFGGAEELFEAQVWVNYDMLRIRDMLDAASKTILQTNDKNFANRNKVRDMDNLETVVLAEGTSLGQVDTFPRNLQLFENHMLMLENHAKDMGAAQDPIQGKEPTSGTPFASLQAQIQQGLGLHEYRRGQFAKHIEEIYKDWIIPHIQKKIVEGAQFLSNLSLEDMQYVTDSVVTNLSNKRIKEMVLNGHIPTEDEVQVVKDTIREDFKKGGNKKFIKILKGEFKDVKLTVKVNVAGKSKNLALAVDKLTNIFRAIFSNPQGFAQVLQIKGMANAFNEMLELSGLSPADFSGIDKIAQAPQQPVEAPQITLEPQPA